MKQLEKKNYQKWHKLLEQGITPFPYLLEWPQNIKWLQVKYMSHTQWSFMVTEVLVFSQTDCKFVILLSRWQ